ncbi:GNAT superfamily N-acetyltransferase [Pararhizobium capsulatum DSM 1112]|uniref:GNAT superfamily N-acetyltransferase n=1 Tax=Pararhizobium capsulatum DSM 1112 TaxID=1121113 RepID=A0ABU0BSX5_9HYPH|nr:GNAT family N-acetyltransferase [Pararhizobium capsulatum]MDQ0321343.1 GNAT superfamily N-acetyltransferase [Pararhizobium capsulatum DSM 1112]
MGEAFDQDSLMLYLFRENPNGVRAGAMEFFSLLLRARIALGMPAYVLQQADSVLGAVMGYDTSRPVWPAALAREWRQFEAEMPGFTGRLAAYEKICEAHQPSEDHYYLGVIGVHPSVQGKGAGKVMLDTFCACAHADPKSHGVYLETSNPVSLQFYYNNGFELRGEGSLDATPLWCVYKRT